MGGGKGNGAGAAASLTNVGQLICLNSIIALIFYRIKAHRLAQAGPHHGCPSVLAHIKGGCTAQLAARSGQQSLIRPGRTAARNDPQATADQTKADQAGRVAV